VCRNAFFLFEIQGPEVPHSAREIEMLSCYPPLSNTWLVQKNNNAAIITFLLSFEPSWHYAAFLGCAVCCTFYLAQSGQAIQIQLATLILTSHSERANSHMSSPGPCRSLLCAKRRNRPFEFHKLGTGTPASSMDHPFLQGTRYPFKVPLYLPKLEISS
jgi:hypothetical protein